MALLLRRAAGVAGLIAAAFLVVFVLVRVLPGDPVARLVVQPGVGAAELAAIRAELGLDRPVAVQLGAYLGAMARGDLGRSLVTGRPVSAEIAARLRAWCADPGVDVVITTGGTGLTGRDVTVEAHRDVYEKEIDAFGTVFTMISMGKIGTSAVQSRACGGVAQGTYLFALPGSPGACRDAWDEILKWQLDYRHRPCNFVEIMPRLEEHQRRK